MSSNTQISGDIVKEYITKYPSISSRKITELLINDIPELFNDPEKTRNQIRYYRGSNGQYNRTKMNVENYMPKINVPISDEVDYSFYNIDFNDNIFPIMAGSDAHIPYHDQDALEIFIERAIEIKAKTIILNGDWIDFYQISNWQKDPRNRSTKDEISLFNEILDMIQNNTEAKIIYKFGNHEERFDNYLMNNAPQLFELEEMHLDKILKLAERNIDVVKDKHIIKLNDLYILHGHEYKFTMTNPVNPARGLFLRAKKNAICGHFHQTSEHTEPTISNSIIANWSIGCLCGLHPLFMPQNKWNHGFAEIYYDDTFFSVRNRKITNYRLV
jgi:UDP-2,3-diacylglucosamine pyrophosphatase LpxH